VNKVALKILFFNEDLCAYLPIDTTHSSPNNYYVPGIAPDTSETMVNKNENTLLMKYILERDRVRRERERERMRE
jgi:hypothetical protein